MIILSPLPDGNCRPALSLTQLPSFSDSGPSSKGSVHRPSHVRNIFHLAKGVQPERERFLPPSSLSLTFFLYCNADNAHCRLIPCVSAELGRVPACHRQHIPSDGSPCARSPSQNRRSVSLVKTTHPEFPKLMIHQETTSSESGG
jgi:hypothetical protein